MMLLVAIVLLGLCNASPVVMWGKNVKGKGAEVFQPVGQSQMLSSLAALAKGSGSVDSALSSVTEDKLSAPKLVVVYGRSFGGHAQFFSELEQHQATDGPLAYLNTVVEGIHGGSAVVPYARLSGVSAFDFLARPLAARLPAGSKLMTTGTASGRNVGHIALDKVCAELPESTTLLFVDLDSSDAALRRLDNCLYERTDGDMLSIFAVAGQDAPQVQRQQRQPVHEFAERMDDADPTRPATYFPTYVFQWLFVILFLVVFFLIGICALSQVQVPPNLLSAAQVSHRKNK